MAEHAQVPPSAGFELHAWVDESIHLDHGSGLYVLVAAVGDAGGCDGVRDELRSLVRKPRRRLHWGAEEPADKLKIAAAVGGFDVLNVVVVGSPVDPRKQERARRKCTERLFHRLHELGVTHVFMETRTESLNTRDIRMIAAMRGAQTIPAGLRVDFERPLDEPMLWVPDAVAGAVGAAMKGSPECRALLESILEEHPMIL